MRSSRCERRGAGVPRSPFRAAGALLAWSLLAAGCGMPEQVDSVCPPGMQLVPGGAFRYGNKDLPRHPDEREADRRLRVTKETMGAFCIDRYEFPNREGARPETGATWLEAASKCRELGRRLCTEYEWEKACRGPKGFLFPWGNYFDMTLCALDAKAAAEHRSGSRSACVSPYGVYDMSGSAWEWTANAWQGSESLRVVRGGWDAELGDKGARCSLRRSRDAATRGPRTGFRCCADATPDLPAPPRLVP
ncbi:MAG: formylglycine-generating enzyme family protein [Planctomycetota bacterium]